MNCFLSDVVSKEVLNIFFFALVVKKLTPLHTVGNFSCLTDCIQDCKHICCGLVIFVISRKVFFLSYYDLHSLDGYTSYLYNG